MNGTDRQRLRQAIDERRRLLEDAPADGINHGTEWAYRKGCRCGECRAVAAESRRRRMAKMTGDERRALWRAQQAQKTLRRRLKREAHA